MAELVGWLAARLGNASAAVKFKTLSMLLAVGLQGPPTWLQVQLRNALPSPFQPSWLMRLHKTIPSQGRRGQLLTGHLGRSVRFCRPALQMRSLAPPLMRSRNLRLRAPNGAPHSPPKAIIHVHTHQSVGSVALLRSSQFLAPGRSAQAVRKHATDLLARLSGVAPLATASLLSMLASPAPAAVNLLVGAAPAPEPAAVNLFAGAPPVAAPAVDLIGIPSPAPT